MIKLRLADGRIYGEDGKADYVSPTVAENTDTITVRGVIPNTKVGMLRQLTDGEL